jgi:hypothetical protein
MVSGDYYPDEDTKYDENSFRLLPYFVIEFKYLLNTQNIVYHLELNSVKLDNHKCLVKKFQMRPMNHSVLDFLNEDINNLNLFFHPNQIVRPRKPS